MRRITYLSLVVLSLLVLLLAACGNATDWQEVAPLGTAEEFQGRVVTLGLMRPDANYTLISGHQINGLVIAQVRVYNSAGALIETRDPHIGDKGVLVSEVAPDGKSVIWVIETRPPSTP